MGRRRGRLAAASASLAAVVWVGAVVAGCPPRTLGAGGGGVVDKRVGGGAGSVNDVWRVPRWTRLVSTVDDPRLTPRPPTLGRAHRLLRGRTAASTIGDWGVCTEGSHHLEMVSGLEEIGDDGRPTAGELSAGGWRGFLAFASSVWATLSTAKPGRFRAFIIALTTRRPTVSEPGGVRALTEYRRDCDDALSSSDAALPLRSDVRLFVLIYEMRRNTEYDVATAVPASSALSAKSHLVGARLWTEAELAGIL